MTLLGTVDLGNNKKIGLKNTEALVSLKGCVDEGGNQIGPRITPPANINVSKLDIQQTVTFTDAEKQLYRNIPLTHLKLIKLLNKMTDDILNITTKAE